MSPQERFSEFCLARGYKCTKQRCALVSEIFRFNKSFTVDELLAALAAKGVSVSRVTTFRTLKILEEAGMIDKDDATYRLP
jgi:Fur family ferric uptake transcriptional regulator